MSRIGRVGMAVAMGLAAVALSGRAEAGFVFNQYNVVTTGDLTMQSHVDLNTFVGGNLVGNANAIFAMNAPAGSGNPVGLTVVGSITAPNVGDIKINNGKNLVMTSLADGSSRVSMNGGGQKIQDAGLPALKALIAQELTDASAGYKALAPNNTVGVSPGNQLDFRVNSLATVDGKKLAIFNISGALFNDISYQNGITLSGSLRAQADTIIVNVSGTSVLHDRTGNFTGPFDTPAIQTRTIFNFWEATTLGIGQQRDFAGAILAPLAVVTKTNQSTDGAIFAREYRVLGGGETHGPLFTGYVPATQAVPEPSTLALAAIGLLGWGLAAARRSRGRGDRVSRS